MTHAGAVWEETMRSNYWLAIINSFVFSALCVGLNLFAGAAQAQDSYPSRPIRLVVTTAAGGSNDLVARAVADRLSEYLGQPVVIENQPAGNGGIAAAQVAKSTPDGHTLMFVVDSTLTINPHLYKNIQYEPFTDFTPVSLVTRAPMVVVAGTHVQANNLQELVAFAKANPGKLNYASTGVGTALHIGMELFKLVTKTEIVHVPYRATTAAMADLMGGRVDMLIITQNSVRPQMEAGKAKILAVAGPKRLPELPQVPTTAEAGVASFQVGSSFSMIAPAKTPRAIVERLAREVKKASTDPKFVATLAPQGMEIVASTPEEMLAIMQADSKKWAEVIRVTGTTINQ
jgi:tripartite-type tricarboxylate transporter receptor subunit TctC